MVWSVLTLVLLLQYAFLKTDSEQPAVIEMGLLLLSKEIFAVYVVQSLLRWRHKDLYNNDEYLKFKACFVRIFRILFWRRFLSN